MREPQEDVNKKLLDKLKKIMARDYDVKTNTQLVKVVLNNKSLDIGIFKRPLK